MTWTKINYAIHRLQSRDVQRAEVPVVREYDATGRECPAQQFGVARTAPAALADIQNVAPFRPQRGDNFPVDVFIGQKGKVAEPHEFTSAETRTSFSRKCTAYRSASSTSSAARRGYARRMSSRPAPEAANSSRNSTLMRVPLMQGFPPNTSGLHTTRLNISNTFPFPQ